MKKTLKLTETELTKLIEKAVIEKKKGINEKKGSEKSNDKSATKTVKLTETELTKLINKVIIAEEEQDNSVKSHTLGDDKVDFETEKILSRKQGKHAYIIKGVTLVKHPDNGQEINSDNVVYLFPEQAQKLIALGREIAEKEVTFKELVDTYSDRNKK